MAAKGSSRISKADSSGQNSRKQIAPGTPPANARKAELRILPSDGSRRRIILTLGREELDITHALTSPFAHALWQLRGGADIANWIDAESLLDDLLARAGQSAPALDVVVPRKRTPAAR